MYSFLLDMLLFSDFRLNVSVDCFFSTTLLLLLDGLLVPLTAAIGLGMPVPLLLVMVEVVDNFERLCLESERVSSLEFIFLEDVVDAFDFWAVDDLFREAIFESTASFSFCLAGLFSLSLDFFSVDVDDFWEVMKLSFDCFTFPAFFTSFLLAVAAVGCFICDCCCPSFRLKLESLRSLLADENPLLELVLFDT